MSKIQNSESEYCRGRAGAGPPLVYVSYVIVRKKKLDTQPQTTTQPTTLSSDEVWKNGISYAVI